MSLYIYRAVALSVLLCTVLAQFKEITASALDNTM